MICLLESVPPHGNAVNLIDIGTVSLSRSHLAAPRLSDCVLRLASHTSKFNFFETVRREVRLTADAVSTSEFCTQNRVGRGSDPEPKPFERKRLRDESERQRGRSRRGFLVGESEQEQLKGDKTAN